MESEKNVQRKATQNPTTVEKTLYENVYKNMKTFTLEIVQEES